MAIYLNFNSHVSNKAEGHGALAYPWGARLTGSRLLVHSSQRVRYDRPSDLILSVDLRVSEAKVDQCLPAISKWEGQNRQWAHYGWELLICEGIWCSHEVKVRPRLPFIRCRTPRRTAHCREDPWDFYVLARYAVEYMFRLGWDISLRAEEGKAEIRIDLMNSRPYQIFVWSCVTADTVTLEETT